MKTKNLNTMLGELYIQNDKAMATFNDEWRGKDRTQEYVDALLAMAASLVSNANQIYRIRETLDDSSRDELEGYYKDLIAYSNSVVDDTIPVQVAGVFEDADPRKGDRIIINTGTAAEPVFRLGTITLVGMNKSINYRLDNGDKGATRISNSASGFVAFTRNSRTVVSPIGEDKLRLYVDSSRWVADAYSKHVQVINTPPVMQPILRVNTDGPVSMNNIIGQRAYNEFGVPYYHEPNSREKEIIYRHIADLVGARIYKAERNVRAQTQIGEYNCAFIDPVTSRHWVLRNITDGDKGDAVYKDSVCALEDIKTVIKFLTLGC